MKRAPVIPKHTIKTQPLEDTPSSAPAAPMVDSLIARVGAMARGNAITLPVCGRDVKFTLEVLRGDSVEKTSRVWSGNERDQELLTEDALDDLIPSFLLTGQQTPAFGRRVSGVIEIADGSRRRKAAALTESDYRVLVGELDDEQMAALSRLGNDYRPTSAYERGQRYASRLQNEFAYNLCVWHIDELSSVGRLPYLFSVRALFDIHRSVFQQLIEPLFMGEIQLDLSVPVTFEISIFITGVILAS